jgi:CDP-diacylglycerol--serine O-phosphatidyltransferase
MIKLLSFADLITLVNAGCGFLAISFLFLHHIRISFSLILLALLADGLDGIVARKIKKSELGEYLEAMADMTSLSLAPLAFVLTLYYPTISEISLKIGFFTILLLFLLCSIIRLSSFHILKHNLYYVGLPASASTIFILILSFLEVNSWLVLTCVVLCSLAMVSPFRFPKSGLRINAIAFFLIVLTIAFGKMMYAVAPLLLIAALIVYSVAGPLYVQHKES